MKKLLVVDDDQFTLDLVSSMLDRDEGDYEVLTASSVREAREKLSDFAADCLITDIVMPAEDGTKLMQYSKSKYPNMPVLAITGGIENARADYVTLADMFSDYTLAKPFTREQLVEAIQSLTDKKGTH